MISARLSRVPSPTTAVAVRLSAALAALATVVVIPVSFASAAVGHIGVASAFETAGFAAAFAIATALAARRVDPLRR